MLVLIAALGAAFGGGGSDDAPDDDAEAAADGGNTPTATAASAPDTAAETATPAPTAATETATPPPDTPSNMHAVGESFVVELGEKSIEYTVTDMRTATSVGSDAIGEESDGVFLIVTLSMTNVGDESLDLTSNVFSAIDSQDREFDVDSDALIYLENSIDFEQLDPGLEKTGVIVFDVGPGDEYNLRIEPAGIFSNAEPHEVELGTVEEG